MRSLSVCFFLYAEYKLTVYNHRSLPLWPLLLPPRKRRCVFGRRLLSSLKPPLSRRAKSLAPFSSLDWRLSLSSVYLWKNLYGPGVGLIYQSVVL